MSRTIVIGDIHGGLKALIAVLEAAQSAPSDRLIFLGDYVDGWSDSVNVIDFLIALEAKQPCIFIKGNHDAWCESWLAGNTADEVWLKHGGRSTLQGYAGKDEEYKKRHLAFFNRMLNYYTDSDNNLFIHAGYTSMHGPEKETYESNYKWDRTLWETAVSMDKHLAKNSELFPKRLLLYEEIYIGHTPTLNYKITVPMHKANIWNMDTGAGFNGALSAMDTDNKALWQSEPLPVYYPDEKGRN